MTDNEIIRALECCVQGCSSDCPLYLTPIGITCEKLLHKNIFNLINRQQAEIERYLHSIKLLEKDVEDAKAELTEKDEMLKAQADTIFLYERVIKDKNAAVERLKDKLFLALHTDTAKRNIEAEAIKRFAERVLKIVTLRGRQKDYFDNLVKEMTEGNG